MIYLSIIFAVYLIVSLWYIRNLRKRLRSHEDTWNQIEALTDHNKDGDVVIHPKHFP